VKHSIDSFASHFLQDSYRRTAEDAVLALKAQPELINSCIELSGREKHPIDFRGARVVDLLDEMHPEFITPSQLQSIIATSKNVANGSVLRHYLRLLSRKKLPLETAFELFDPCYSWLGSEDVPVAAKVHAMEILAYVCQLEPDLIPEVMLHIKSQAEMGAASYKARSRSVLKRLDKTLKRRS